MVKMWKVGLAYDTGMREIRFYNTTSCQTALSYAKRNRGVVDIKLLSFSREEESFFKPQDRVVLGQISS